MPTVKPPPLPTSLPSPPPPPPPPPAVSRPTFDEMVAANTAAERDFGAKVVTANNGGIAPPEDLKTLEPKVFGSFPAGETPPQPAPEFAALPERPPLNKAFAASLKAEQDAGAAAVERHNGRRVKEMELGAALVAAKKAGA
jgi:hypothetical protein